MSFARGILTSCLLLFATCAAALAEPRQTTPMPTDNMPALQAWMQKEMRAAYSESPFMKASSDYFSRFSRDPDAKPVLGEIEIGADWGIAVWKQDGPVAAKLANDLSDFLKRSMGVDAKVVQYSGREEASFERGIVLHASSGGDPAVSESYTLTVADKSIGVLGRDIDGLRAGVVTLVDLIGTRQAPILHTGTTVYKPRLAVRMGPVPYLGGYRELAFMGFNAVTPKGYQLYDIAMSDAIPELAVRRKPGAMEELKAEAKKAKEYGLKEYIWLAIQKKFPKDDPVFKAHPEIRGALTWKADGEYILCTEHPLVQRWLDESVQHIFREVPELDGAYVIIGGEGFYHCFMRAFGVPKGHTTCTRCEPLGPDVVVSNLVNRLAESARKVRPNAEVIAWPYSAEHVWSSDKAQSGFIARLKPGTGLFTEMEKDEAVMTPEGVHKGMWDYSLHMTGAGDRAKAQIAACKKVGVPCYLKSEPDDTFEAPRLSHLPAMDRWAKRAEALASCGGSGTWIFSGFHLQFASLPCELQHQFFWEPHESQSVILADLAARVAGRAAGPELRRAWAAVSQAIEHSPEIPQYYTGPYYLGPAHPMIADATAQVPPEFFGRYLFMAEMTDEEGLRLRPTYFTGPTVEPAKKELAYRNMERHLKRAADEIEAARPKVPDRCKVGFDSEASQILWLYRTERTQANFFESCRLRDALGAMWKTPKPEQRDEAKKLYDRWMIVLADELQNAKAAIPLMDADVRLDFQFFGDHTFAPGGKMLRAKVALVEHELREYLPARWAAYEKALQTTPATK